MESNDKQTGFTYFIQEGYDNFFKIGHTYGDVEKRKNDLQTGNSTELRVFGKIETAEPERLESELKKLFTNEHQRGEWFCIDPSDAVDIIKEKNGVICVEDPLKVRISFDKETYKKQIIQEVTDDIRKELDIKYEQEIKKFSRSKTTLWDIFVKIVKDTVEFVQEGLNYLFAWSLMIFFIGLAIAVLAIMNFYIGNQARMDARRASWKKIASRYIQEGRTRELNVIDKIYEKSLQDLESDSLNIFGIIFKMDDVYISK